MTPRYGRYFVIALAVALSLLASVQAGARLLGVPPNFETSFGVNHKVMFLRDHLPTEPVVLVTGASMATNNLDTDRMQAVEGQPYFNFGAYGLEPADEPLVHRYFTSVAPVREVIYVTQYLEYNSARRGLTMSQETFRRYVLRKMTVFEEVAYRDLNGLWFYLTKWNRLRTAASSESVLYTRTGATPLTLDVRENDPENYWAKLIKVNDCNGCMDPIEQSCRDAVTDGQRFTVVVGPLRRGLYQQFPHLVGMATDRKARMKAALQRCGGTLEDFSETVSFEDPCFSDFTHYNAKGMRRFTELVLARRAGRPTPSGLLPCE